MWDLVSIKRAKLEMKNAVTAVHQSVCPKTYEVRHTKIGGKAVTNVSHMHDLI